MNRRSFYHGKVIKHSGWAPEWKIRLALRDKSHWTGYEPHPNLQVDGRVANLQGYLYHNPFRTISHHAASLNHYTDVLASRPAGKWRYRYGLVLEPPLTFLQKFFLQGGFLDGTRGFLVSAMTSFYYFLRYAKAWEAFNEAPWTDSLNEDCEFPSPSEPLPNLSSKDTAR